MGHIKAPRRARSAAAKEERRHHLLATARTLLGDRPFHTLAMGDLAAAAGVAKGTVFLYFPTKETLGLALVEELLDEWFDALDSRLGTLRAGAAPARIADAIVHVTRVRRPLVRLLVLLGPWFEHHVGEDAAQPFKARLLVRTIQLGAAFERLLPVLAQGEGARLCLAIHAIITGLQQMAEPAPVIAAILAQPAFQPLRVDFDEELQHLLDLHLRGLVAAASPRARARRSA
jgi:AcrR family transcriptional regulator